MIHISFNEELANLFYDSRLAEQLVLFKFMVHDF